MLTTTDAAARLNCDTSTVRRWCKRESIGTRHGRDWLLSDADLKRLAGFVQSGPGRPRSKPSTFQ